MQRCKREMLFLFLFGAATFIIYLNRTSLYLRHPLPKCTSHDILREGLIQLRSILMQENVSAAAYQRTNKLIDIIDGKLEDASKEVTDTSAVVTSYSLTINSERLLEVCPEEWLGPKAGNPLYFKGWKSLNCTTMKPFEQVLTIILFIPFKNNDDTCPNNLLRILEGLNTLYPKLSIIISHIFGNCLSVNSSLHVQWIARSETSTPGSTWNRLAKHVSTPYVLVGRDMDDFLWTTDLERQVRMISYNPDISVAGGAVRNYTGHWRVGCWQTTMSNYILEYKDGYYSSMNSCMFCDHLTGPFVARTKVIQSIKLNESLPAAVLFEDWFWQVKQAKHKVVDCPDVMYSASDPAADKKTKRHVPWIPLARKWGLNRIVIPSGRTFSFSCLEAGLSCTDIMNFTSSFLMPICCVEQLAAAIGIFNAFCRKHNLRYELSCGTTFGAVKMNDLMPWDVDGDMRIYAANMTFFKTNAQKFKKHGIIFKSVKGKQKFLIYTPDLSFDTLGCQTLSHDHLLGKPFRSVPTQVEFHGHWVYAPHSPGAYARNQYGIEIFRHAHSWIQMGKKDGLEPYKSGYFKKCKTPKHHACLDHFSADGNIQFKIPN